MFDLAMVSLLLAPNIVLAATSKSGNNAGYYILAAWGVLAAVAGVWSIGFFICAALVLVVVAVLFRDRLRIGAFFAQRASSRRK
jgi:hypothetical protein